MKNDDHGGASSGKIRYIFGITPANLTYPFGMGRVIPRLVYRPNNIHAIDVNGRELPAGQEWRVGNLCWRVSRFKDVNRHMIGARAPIRNG